MPLTSKDYRSHLYENRSHPEQAHEAQKSSVSFSLWLFSAIPFLLVEYFLQVEFKKLPSGLMFPAGFLFFWGFYQTLQFSKEKNLSKPLRKMKWEFPDFRKIKVAKKTAPPIKQNVHRIPIKKSEDFLPEKVLQNLSVLGLKPTREWNVIQKRYRELAKQYHPDLNPEVTTRGTRFMIYDSAYRNLLKVKKDYFR